jgi:hypothetical protein
MPLLLLCLAAAGCAAQPDIPVAAAGGKTGYVVTGSVYGFHPSENDAKAAAVAKVASACPTGADVSTIQTTPSQMTFGYLTSTYTATVVCR